MEPAIFGILAFTLTVMLYLDRSRRNESRDLCEDMNTSVAELRKETHVILAELRKDMNDGFAQLREVVQASAERTDARIDQLTATVMSLAESLGQVKGRSETLVAAE